MNKDRKLVFQKLQIPAGWQIQKNIFFDVEPISNEIEGLPKDENGLPIFEAELIFAQHENSKWILDMGWIGEDDPKGEFQLDIIKGSFRDNDPIIICQTKDKDEIVEAVNKTMLRISQESGDIEQQCLPLKDLIIRGGWKVAYNSFFDIKSLKESEKLTFLRQHSRGETNTILRLESWPSAEQVIELSWQVIDDNQICYTAVTFYGGNAKDILIKFQTKDIEEVAIIIEKLCLWKDTRPKSKRPVQQSRNV
ncbi:MAG: hypothetical protein JNN15_07765 [Blastocatellia bacterium]|nr:hypothetical protein [Blastocatellia bacterium]